MSRRERQKRRRRNHGHPVKRVVLASVGLGICALAVAALAAVGWVVAVADTAQNIKDIQPATPKPLSEIFAADGTPLGYVHSDTVYEFVPGDKLPTLLKDATVAIEDRRFYQHGALDYQGILRAGIKDVFSGGTSLQGASTLTMQLVDNMYLSHSVRSQRNLKYKIIQAKLAEELEGQHTKHWILDTYLNDVPYGTVDGETAHGVGAAAQIFFNRPVDKLDLAQYALLAGLPQAPSEYNPFLNPTLARARRHEVLQAMMKAGYITPDQATHADRSSLQIHSSQKYSPQHVEPYVFDYALKEAEARYGVQKVQTGGLKIYTTIDLHDQDIARRALLAHEGGSGNPAAALTAVDPTNGHIVAMASTASYTQTKFDYPIQAQRQPGSAFKLFALMTLIHDYHGDPNQTYYTSKELNAGWDPAEPTWSVHTAELSYQGTINITRATITSDNTVFAQLAVDLGMDKFDAMAHAMGITSKLDANPSEVIGGVGGGVNTAEMADAYATVSNGGTHVPLTIISKVVFPDGSVDTWDNAPRTRVFTDGESAAAIGPLKGVIQSGTGTAANYGCPAAGKTGTAENFANAWFVGFTPKLSTAVWVGYPQGNIPMANGFGGTLAAPIWHDFMSAASNGYCGDFPPASTPFAGTPFFGPHSATGNPTAGTGTGTTTGASSAPQNPYNNPTLFAHPPAPKTGKGNGGGTGTGPAAGPGTGTGTGTGGKGGGGGGGKGGGGGTGGAGVPGH